MKLRYKIHQPHFWENYITSFGVYTTIWSTLTEILVFTEAFISYDQRIPILMVWYVFRTFQTCLDTQTYYLCHWPQKIWIGFFLLLLSVGTHETTVSGIRFCYEQQLTNLLYETLMAYSAHKNSVKWYLQSSAYVARWNFQ